MIDVRPRAVVLRDETRFPVYTRAERLADGVLHIIGVLAALIAVPVMVTLSAVWYGDASTIGAAVIYGVSLIAMLTCSASYHMMRAGRKKQLLRRLDHAAIYVKIAGTYTLFAVLLAGDATLPIVAGIWGAALVGVGFKMVSARRWATFTLALYLAMGWAVVVVGAPILKSVSPGTFTLITAGGVLYTIGVLFLYWERLRFHNAIWHALVLAATFLIYAGILNEVARLAPAVVQ
ncbi:MAG: hemolysin III family protein [Paracoccaceae bacterium]|nr:hemolysin III family protein [Paracoccaceae bacterium]